MHRRKARASEGPKVLENVSSERPIGTYGPILIDIPHGFIWTDIDNYEHISVHFDPYGPYVLI